MRVKGFRTKITAARSDERSTNQRYKGSRYYSERMAFVEGAIKAKLSV